MPGWSKTEKILRHAASQVVAYRMRTVVASIIVLRPARSPCEVNSSQRTRCVCPASLPRIDLNRMPEIRSLRVTSTSDERRNEEFCPVCGRPENYCEVCGGPHDARRPHKAVPGERVRFTHDDVLAIRREIEAWEGSVEYERDVRGVRAHTATLRALVHKLELVLRVD